MLVVVNVADVVNDVFMIAPIIVVVAMIAADVAVVAIRENELNEYVNKRE